MRVTVGSFRIKLVAYFLLLSLLPMAAAFWGFTTVAGQSETRRVDARLQAGMRAILADYQLRLDGAQNEAKAVAKTPIFQKEIERRDLPGLVHHLQDARNVSVRWPDGGELRRAPGLAATREVPVVTRNGLIGYVKVAVPFDAALVEQLRAHSGLKIGRASCRERV